MDLERKTDIYVTIKFSVPDALKIPCEELSAWIADFADENIYEITINDKNGKEIWGEIGGCVRGN